ncbi:MAG TPA: hypothetical protein VEW67_09980 [Thermoleophilaceae bacterium]|nr:hypothetical protein [Thermoleophilaceae bacterium]
MMVRRALAAGAGLLVLIVLVFGVRGCLDSRNDSAINDWVRDVDALMKESNGESDALFQQLGGGDGGTDVDVENALNSFRIQSAQLVDRAAGLDHPGDLDAAQSQLVETLTFRAEGIAQIADALPNALTDGDQAEGAAGQIADAMQLFLTSDQIYVKRVIPEINQVVKDAGLTPSLTESTFLKDLSWLDPAEVADRLSGIATGGGTDDEEAAPGLHGNGLGTVTLGGQTLTPGASTSVTASGDLSFDVQVLNQGENTETDVKVTATVGSGGDEITAEGVIETIAAGEAQTVSIPLDGTPPTGQAVPITIEVELVPGEDESVGNNAADFSVIFTS